MTSVFLTDEKKEERNQAMMPTMITVMAQKMTKVEKTFKVLGIDGESTYAFGEKISYTDLGKVMKIRFREFRANLT